MFSKTLSRSAGSFHSRYFISVSIKQLLALFFIPFLVACSNPLGGKASIDAGFLTRIPASAALSISINHSNITAASSDTSAYLITGGTPPYTVSANQGTLSNATGSGTFTATGAIGPTTITVTDSVGATAQQIISVQSNLVIGVMTAFPSGLLGRYGHSAASISGKMYVFGGMAPSAGYMADLWAFDSSVGTDGSWAAISPTGSAPSMRYHHSAVAISGKMYIFGGATGLTDYNDLTVFDPNAGSTGSWTTLSPSGTAPSARFGHSAVVINNKMYLFGGFGSTYFNDTWVFDPNAGANGSWTQLSPTGALPPVRNGHSAVVISNKMYVFGGYGGSPLNDVWVFDPQAGAQGSWIQLSPSGPLPGARDWHIATALSGKMYIFAGIGWSATDINDTWCFDPTASSNGSWTSLSPLGSIPAPVDTFSAVGILGKMYIFGGGGTNTTSKFDPTVGVGGSWTQLSPGTLVNTATLAVNDTLPYLIAGGAPPIVVTTVTGSVNNTTGSGNYTAGSVSGSDTITATDALGNTATATISIDPPLTIATTLSYIGSTSTTNYVVNGGVAPYFVSVDNGTIDTPTGSGLYTANGNQGTATITVTDSLGNSTNVLITIGDLTISPSQLWVEIGNAISYSVSGGDGNYSVSVDNGTVDTPNGSGTYYAYGSIGIANLQVTDGGYTANVAVAVNTTLTVNVTNTTLNQGDVTTYTVSGGSGNYSVYSEYGGYADNSTGSGNYYAYNSWGWYWDYLYVYDNLTGESQQIYINIVQPLSIYVNSYNLNYGDGDYYSISGGDGCYSVSSSTGGQINDYGGWGYYYAYTNAGYDYINVYDYCDGQSASVYLTINSPLYLNVDNTNLNYGDSSPFEVSGGSGNYYVSTNYGYVDNPYGSGTYYAYAPYGYDYVYVYDYSTGQSNSVYISVGPPPPPSISFNSTTLNYGDAVPYTVSGGSGNYSVSTTSGSTIDNPYGSGTYFADGYGSTDTVTVYDNNTGQSSNVVLTINGAPPAMTLTVANTSLVNGGTTTYTVTGGSGNYYIYTATGGALDNSYGSGTYTASVCCGYTYDYIYANDQSSGLTLSTYIAVTAAPLTLTVTSNTLSIGNTTTYTVAGGTGYYSVAVDFGGVSNGAGSGTYTANTDGGGYINITASDNLSSATVTKQIAITGAVQIIANPNAIMPSGTASYSVANQNTAPYSWTVDVGSLNHSSGVSGTYTATSSTGTAHIQVTDALGNTGTAAITVSNSPGVCTTPLYTGNGTSASPWVTSPALNSCYAIRQGCSGNPAGSAWSSSSGTGQDGIYTISVSGTTLNVYCDMTTDGGGWTRVVGINATNVNHSNTAAVAWTGGDPQSYGKLSDAQINAIKSSTSTTEPVFRLTCGETAYFPGSCTFNATNASAANDCLKFTKSYTSHTWYVGSDGDHCGQNSEYVSMSAVQLSQACAGYTSNSTANLNYRRTDWRGVSYDGGCANTHVNGALFVR